MKFNLRGTPGRILAIMVAPCLFAVSAALIEFLYPLVSLAGSDRGGWHGVPGWFVIVWMMSFFLSMFARATMVISTPIAFSDVC